MANINANVMFKRGKQKDLNKYLASYTSADKKTAIEGAFYLTEDTNRLYVGKKLSNNEVKAVPVNQGVITVAAVRNLPNANTVEPGQFYYAEEENVLCIYSGSGQKAGWVQINPDTNTKITGKSYTGNLIDTNFVQITDVVSQSNFIAEKEDELTRESFTSGFAVKGTDGVNVSVEEYTDENNKKRPRLVISQNAYTLTSQTDGDGSLAILTLTDGKSTDKVTFKGGNNVTFKPGDNDETITINAKDTVLNTNELTFSNGTLVSTLTDTSGNQAQSSVTPIITIGPDKDGNGTDVKFTTSTAANGEFKAVLPVYTKAQVDDKIRTLNAMVYKGTLGTGGVVQTIPTSPSVGDTYKIVSTQILNESDTANPGDTIIARSTHPDLENADGVIPQGYLVWDIIPSGDDAESDTTYYTKTTDSGFVLVENDGANGNKLGGLKLSNKDSAASASTATYLTITNDSASTIDKDNEINSVVIKHNEQDGLAGVTHTVKVDDVDRKQNPGSSINVTVPVLNFDKAGHITSVETQVYNLVDTKFEYDLEYLKITEGSTTYDLNTGELSASAKIQASLLDKHTNQPDVADFNIKSSTLALRAEKDGNDQLTGNLLLNIEWGSF